MTKLPVLSTDLREPCWYLIDANDKTLGRLSSEIAKILLGKHKPNYSSYLDNGDHIIVINTKNLRVTGKKEKSKLYYNHSGYPGGLRTETLGHLRDRFPEKILERAVKGMLPKNSLGRKVFKNVKIYRDSSHPHEAQKPTLIELFK